MSAQPSQPLILRVSDFAQPLIEHLKRNAEVKSILPRRRLSFQVGGERYCYLILKGCVMTHRESDDLAVATATAPALVGIINLHNLELKGYIKTLVPCEIAILNMATVHNIIDTHQLWEPLAKHIMVLAGKLFQSSEQLSAPLAYDIIRAQLNELINEAPVLRENTTAERYIRDKTHLSRSGVMRILASLKEGGYIKMERGILTEIVKLPEKF